jgi:hypothetical protein
MTVPSGFFVGQIGAKIILETGDDALTLAAATALKINYRRPSGTTGSWTATLEGTALAYTTTAIADLSEAGAYRLQAYGEGPGWKAPGAEVTMVVQPPIVAVA